MRFNKRVELSGEAPICPIELSDLVVGMNHLGWAPLSHDRYVLRKRSLFKYWIEAEIDDSGGQRTLALQGRAPLSERRRLEALMDALHQGRRWLSREGPLG